MHHSDRSIYLTSCRKISCRGARSGMWHEQTWYSCWSVIFHIQYSSRCGKKT